MNLVKIKPEEYGLQEDKAVELLGNLPQIKKERKVLETQYNEIIKLPIEEKETQSRARELRLLIQKNRTQGINKWHKTAKDFFLKGGQFCDAIKRLEVEINERMENNLAEIEKYAEIQEKKRIEELQNKRVELISPYVDDAELLQLGEMAEDVWQPYFESKKKAYEDEQERLRKEEEERQERIRIDNLRVERETQLREYWQFVPEAHPNFGYLSDEEWEDFLAEMQNAKADYDKRQEAIRIENERLKKEAEEKEKQRQKEEAKRKAKEEKERKEREEKVRKEREVRERLEAELRAKKEAEARALRMAEEYKQAELKKGDADKVKDLIRDLRVLKTKYSFKSKKYQATYSGVIQLIDKVIAFINK